MAGPENSVRREIDSSLPRIIGTDHYPWNQYTWTGQYFFRFDDGTAVGIEIPFSSFLNYSRIYWLPSHALDNTIADQRKVTENDSAGLVERARNGELSYTGTEKEQFIIHLRLIDQYRQELHDRQRRDKDYLSYWPNDVKVEIPDIGVQYGFLSHNWKWVIEFLTGS